MVAGASTLAGISTPGPGAIPQAFLYMATGSDPPPHEDISSIQTLQQTVAAILVSADTMALSATATAEQFRYASRGSPRMHPFIEKMVRHVQSTPPSCLSGFRVSSCDSEPWKDWAGWSLTCGCGASKGKVLGYPLKDYDPEYNGPPIYISPLAFMCASCGKTTEIIDTDLHGYNAEIEKMSGRRYPTVRGVGERMAIPCPHCQTTEFSVRVFCAHPHFDLIEDEPELEPRAQEYFDSFDCHGVCGACGEESSLANFELA